MADSYLSFLRSPGESALAPGASLHYVTTTTSIHEASAIIKHFQAQERVVKKKSETILSSFGSPDGAVVETETTFEFVRGGGAILPQMDDNMLADSLAVIPLVHVVQYDGQGKINQIRLYWDQATMLKQVEAIGKSGRNWPIRDGAAQVKTVKHSVNNSTTLPSRPANSAFNESGNARQDRDFHARIIATGEGIEPRSPNSANPLFAPRTSAKPAPRQWDELFTTEASKGSPKPEGLFKSGAGKNFGDNRLFDEDKNANQVLSPESKKVHPERFNHFEFGNGENAPPRDPSRSSSAKAKKHTSQWDFKDFVTPEKIKSKPNREQERHIGPGLDERQSSPEKRPVVHAPRPDANAHFDIADESPAGPKAPFTNKTNVDKTRRGDEYGHFSMTSSPSAHDENAPLTKKVRSDMEPHFKIGETEAPRKIYKTAGNGIGGRTGAPSLWDEPEPAGNKPIYKTYGNGMGGRRDGGLSWSIGDEGDESKGPAIYKTRGDGMGGRRDVSESDANAGSDRFATTASSARAANQGSVQGSDEYEF